MTPGDCPVAPISWGELLDKITILEIKRERIGSPAARANVERELQLLSETAAPVLGEPRIVALQQRLKAINERLWEIEDEIRRKEAERDFGDAFILLARSVYKRNDARAAVKRDINVALDSTLVEEKSYADTGIFFGGSAGEEEVEASLVR